MSLVTYNGNAIVNFTWNIKEVLTIFRRAVYDCEGKKHLQD
jgi:hypothetical protein